MRALVLVLVLAAACGATAVPPPRASRVSALVKARPFEIHVPPHYDPARATPLVVLLHGYTDEPDETDAYFRMHEVADAATFLLALPGGTRDSAGNRFWSATDACCDFTGTGVDDVAYLTAVLDDIEARYHVDLDRVYVVGHSNGGFMALRLACELAPRIAAVAVHAGSTWLDPARCRPAALRLPSRRVRGRRLYPSVHETVARWAAIDGCTGPLTGKGRLDLDTSLPGDETVQEAYSGCRGTAVELWTMHGADHMAAFARAPAPPALAEAIWAFLAAHPRMHTRETP